MGGVSTSCAVGWSGAKLASPSLLNSGRYSLQVRFRGEVVLPKAKG